ncbi:hypothetical protein L0O81_17220, partial [Oliverpabstia sp. DFI.9.49]|nr:hypothetical protein [Oliverpabstia sp. DFI.9.49]
KNIEEIQKQHLTSDELIPFKYTVSNYYAILIDLAAQKFDEVQHFSEKLKTWMKFEDAYLDIKTERIHRLT